MMKQSLSNLYRDERGAVVVMVGALLALLLVFSVYAIDTSQMLLVKTQLQNAADAGALSGAMAYGAGSDSAAAVDAAILAAGANNALIQVGSSNSMASVAITEDDIEFPGQGRVRVTTHRTTATGDNFMNYFLRIFDTDGEIGEMTASATAGFAPVCGGSCFKPWAVPDRWCDSVGTGDCDNGDGKYEPTKGEFYDPVTTGYNNADAGVPITIVPDQGMGAPGAALAPQYYNAVQFPPVNRPEQGSPDPGQSVYREWIAGCVNENVTVEIGDLLRIAPGASPGNPQARNRVRDIIDSDEFAEWDPTTQSVINSNSAVSPRIIKMALVDPNYGIQGASAPGGGGPGGPGNVRVVKIVAMFLENIDNQGRISGRFMYLADSQGIVCSDPSTPSYLYRTVLVE